jgi:cytochrome c2
MKRVHTLVLLSALALLATGCAGTSLAAADRTVPGGDASRGPQAISKYGCGACHSIPGVAGANGQVGPPLGGFGERMVIAGRLANTPDNLERWIMDPQAVSPGTDMPEMGVSEPDARDIAAYLYSQRAH